jgi:hypothetical protein
MANGKGDAWVTDLARKLSRLDGPVWVAFHHEPEGDGDIKEWTRMQAHLAPIVRSTASNVAYTIVLTGYDELYGPAKYRLSSLWPKHTKIDVAGFDVYDKYGVVKNGKRFSTHTDMLHNYFKPFGTWAKAHGVAWGIAETGFSDQSFAHQPSWPTDTYNQLVRTGGVAFTYFNTKLNSISTWALTTAGKQAAFAAALAKAPWLR